MGTNPSNDCAQTDQHSGIDARDGPRIGSALYARRNHCRAEVLGTACDQAISVFGAPGGIRTPDLLIRRYRGTSAVRLGVSAGGRRAKAAQLSSVNGAGLIVSRAPDRRLGSRGHVLDHAPLLLALVPSPKTAPFTMAGQAMTNSACHLPIHHRVKFDLVDDESTSHGVSARDAGRGTANCSSVRISCLRTCTPDDDVDRDMRSARHPRTLPLSRDCPSERVTEQGAKLHRVTRRDVAILAKRHRVTDDNRALPVVAEPADRVQE
jgi:hypothetical protein